MFCQTTFSSLLKKRDARFVSHIEPFFFFFSSVAFDFVLGGVWCAQSICSIFTVAIGLTTFYISCTHLFRLKKAPLCFCLI